MNELVDHRFTDKGTVHSYLDVYESLFTPIRESCRKVLEIGVQRGGSMKLWNDYFPNAEIYGYDVDLSAVQADLSSPRIHVSQDDAYSDEVVKTLEPLSFDVLIDDGPHTKESMVVFAQLYPQFLKEGGICVIEDVQSMDWVPDILKAFPGYMRADVVDRRGSGGRNRYDDILIVARRVPVETPKIVFVSFHHPKGSYFAEQTRKQFTAYTARHGYGFYYDEETPTETEPYQLHYRRCVSVEKASHAYPDSKWYVWVDSDVFVNRPHRPVELEIDLSNPHILYHLFHEKPWVFPINTGVKFVNRDALGIEREVYYTRNTPPWNEFPYEQKNIAEHILPKIRGFYKIHDPYKLNFILYQPKYGNPRIEDAVFVHMCGRGWFRRDQIMRCMLEEGRIPSAEENDALIDPSKPAPEILESSTDAEDTGCDTRVSDGAVEAVVQAPDASLDS